MAIEIYHQIGHNSNWNFQSINDDRTGEGGILASSYMERVKIEALDHDIKSTSIFDPQFFLPNVQVRRLSSYNFFPGRAGNGFQTDNYADELCDVCAEHCVRFQIDQDFSKIIIPTRYLTGMPPNFITQQEQLFVNPFLNAIGQFHCSKPILLQLVLNDNMIKNADYSDDLLNWITRIPRISGVYLIADINPRLKQLRDIEYLLAYMKFIDALKRNDMYVLLGYENTESILMTLANPDAITMGAYENLRMFNIRNYEDQEGQTTRGPNARIYVSQLCQWIDNNYIGAIRRRIGDHLFDDNYYQALMFQPTYRWHFTKPELYKHYFLVFSDQIRSITNACRNDRYNILANLLNQSLRKFGLLEQSGIILDSNSDGSHIAPWITVANLYAVEQGWRS